MLRKEDLGELLTTKQVAERLKSSTDYVIRLALRGEIASIKIGSRPGAKGGRRLFPAREVERWLEAKLQRA